MVPGERLPTGCDTAPPGAACAAVVSPYAAVWPIWNQYWVGFVFGLTLPLSVAPPVVMFVAAPVVTAGGGGTNS